MQVIEEKLAKNPCLSAINCSLTFLIAVLEVRTNSFALVTLTWSQSCNIRHQPEIETLMNVAHSI